MNKEIQYINIREILSRLQRHPLLQDVTLEQVIQYTIDFIGIFGMPNLYSTKEIKIPIEDYRGILPCDLISIIQAKDCQCNISMRSMTDSFLPKGPEQERTFKTQGRVIYTSFKEGDVLLSYKAVAIDEEGYPLLIDMPEFLKTLELYIKKEVFTILFDMGRITPQVLQNTQQEYYIRAGQLTEEFTIPSISEMESIKNAYCTLRPRMTSFDRGFKDEGKREYIKQH